MSYAHLRASGALALILSAVSGLGCGASPASLCNAICDCTGCSDTERDDCVDDLDDDLKEAEAEGCGDQADALVDCYEDELECRDDRVTADGCEVEADALQTCGKGGSSLPGGNACERLDAAAEVGGCGSGSSGNGQDCSRGTDLERTASCYLSTVADVCKPTTEELAAFSECVQG